MKHTEPSAVPGNQAKAISFLVVCFAASLVLSTAVVAYVAKWLLAS